MMDIVAGHATRTITSTLTETISVTITSSQVSGATISSSGTIHIVPNVPVKFALDHTNITATVGQNVVIGVIVQDQYNNTYTDALGSDVFFSTNGSVTGDLGFFTLVNGARLFTITDTVAQRIAGSVSVPSIGTIAVSTFAINFIPGLFDQVFLICFVYFNTPIMLIISLQMSPPVSLLTSYLTVMLTASMQ